MDIPKAPDEPEVKNIIDKLANFVARNGMEFEKMTKDKQKGNPKFGFLFGGEHYNYYQYKLRMEQQIQSQQGMNPQAAQESMVQHSLQNAPWQQPPQQQPPIPPLMPPFPRFQPQMPQQMGGRMPMPNMPPWQQTQQMGQRPPMNMQRFMPPTSGQNMRPTMGQPPSNQMFPNQPPPGANQSGPNRPIQPNQQMGPPPPQNFNMFRQPPPNMPPQHNQPPPQHQEPPFQPPFQYQEPPPMHQRPPPPFNQPPDMRPPPSQNDQFRDPLPQGEYQQERLKPSQENEEDEIAKAEEDAKKKIKQSDDNLKQQYEVLMQQQRDKIETAIAQAQEEKLKNMASKTGIVTPDFDAVLQPIIITCTKDSISSGKSWILTNAKSYEHCRVVGLHLLKRVLEAEKMSQDESMSGKAKFDVQLHIVYLINDVLHHASRKGLKDLSTALQSVILPIFCMTNANATDEERERLTKLLGLWQKFKYFSADLLEKLKDPTTALSNYQANLITEHADAVQQVQSDVQKQYSQYQQQHEQYASHVEAQVKEKREAFEKKKEKAKQEENSQGGQFETYEGNNIPPWANNRDNFGSKPPMEFDYGHSNNEPPQAIDYGHTREPAEWQEGEFGPRPPWNQGPSGPRVGGPWQEGPPWGGGPRPRGPGPHGPPPPIDVEDPSLIPTVPYYDLPAGLMCPLVKLEDSDYKSLDPALIRLPAPAPPSERLLAALEAFYGPPSHERPRNVDGWEKNGLFEFYRAKVRAKRRKEGNLSRSKSKSKSKSRSRSRSRSGSRRSYSRSDSSRSRSRSRSSRSRSRSRSKSPRQRSRSPDRTRRSRSRSPDRRRSRSRDRDDRAQTPPLGISPYSTQDPDGKLGDENRGAQMLKRMGWGGAGLGAKEQGREDPLGHGEVRDKYDQFKGLGMPTDDPYESFRKSKSQGFITRLKARDKEREKERGTPRRNRKDEDQR